MTPNWNSISAIAGQHFYWLVVVGEVTLKKKLFLSLPTITKSHTSHQKQRRQFNDCQCMVTSHGIGQRLLNAN